MEYYYKHLDTKKIYAFLPWAKLRTAIFEYFGGKITDLTQGEHKFYIPPSHPSLDSQYWDLHLMTANFWLSGFRSDLTSFEAMCLKAEKSGPSLKARWGEALVTLRPDGWFSQPSTRLGIEYSCGLKPNETTAESIVDNLLVVAAALDIKSKGAGIEAELVPQDDLETKPFYDTGWSCPKYFMLRRELSDFSNAFQEFVTTINALEEKLSTPQLEFQLSATDPAIDECGRLCQELCPEDRWNCCLYTGYRDGFDPFQYKPHSDARYCFPLLSKVHGPFGYRKLDLQVTLTYENRKPFIWLHSDRGDSYLNEIAALIEQ